MAFGYPVFFFGFIKTGVHIMRPVHWGLGLAVACGGLLGVVGCGEDNEKLVTAETPAAKTSVAPGTTNDPEEMYRKQMQAQQQKKWPSSYPGAKRNKKA